MNLSIFDMMYPKYKITKPIRLIECFAGYGSQALALKYLGVPFEHWKICEWAVKSIQAYKDIHYENDNTDYSKSLTKEEIINTLYNLGISQNYNEPMIKEQIARINENQLRTILNNIIATNNMVNIQQVKGENLEIIDTDKYEYIMTYSFPCQDLSLAGKGKGMSDTSTRSGLLWEVERILTECKQLGNMPQVLLMENVPQVHSLDNMPDFHKWQVRLEELGYHSYWQDLIATDYGIPQTRNRCFMVSILGDYSYTFPQPIPLKLKLKDMLEDNVGSKYYLSDIIQNKILSVYEGGNDIGIDLCDSKSKNREVCSTIKSRYDCGFEHFSPGPTGIIDNKYYLSNKMIDYITSKDDKYKVNDNSLIINRKVACSKTTREGNTRADASDYICDNLPENYNLTCLLKNKGTQITKLTENANTLMARDYKGFGNQEMNAVIHIKNNTKQGYLEATDGDGIDLLQPNSETRRGRVQKQAIQTLDTMGGDGHGVVTNDLRIRKLTPRECFRLMGVKDEDFDNVKKNQSDSSLYHLAGDSIVVNVLMAIFKELL